LLYPPDSYREELQNKILASKLQFFFIGAKWKSGSLRKNAGYYVRIERARCDQNVP